MPSEVRGAQERQAERRQQTLSTRLWLLPRDGYNAASANKPAPTAPPIIQGPEDVCAPALLEDVLDVLVVLGATVTVTGCVEVLFIVRVTSTAWYVIPLAPTVVVVLSMLPPPNRAWTQVAESVLEK